MATPDASPRLIRALAAAVLVATFLAGILAGLGLHRWLGPPGPGGPPPPPPPPGMGLYEQLGLSDEQRTKIEQIFERGRPQAEQVAREVFPKLRAIHESMEAEAIQVLTPAQRKRLEELRAKHPMGPPGGPFGGPPPFGHPPPGGRPPPFGPPPFGGPPPGGPPPDGPPPDGPPPDGPPDLGPPPPENPR